MGISYLEETRSLLGALEAIAEPSGDSPSESELETKARILEVSAEISHRLVQIEDGLKERQRERASSIENSSTLTALGRVSAEVGYKIHNLLGVLGARLDISEMCVRNGDSPKALTNLRIAKDQFQKVQTLAVSLINFSESPKKNYRSDLNELIRGVTSFARMLSQYENIDFDLDLSRDLAQVSLDPVRWQQLLLSLLSNAADAVGRRKGEGGRVHIATANDSNGRVVIRIEDFGQGISPEDLPRVFEAGFSTKGPSREGLGLSVCQTIVKDSGGEMSMESARGEGTRITILIPAG